MLRRALTLLVLMFALPSAAQADQVVLVVSAASPVLNLNSVDIRKLFLGWPVFDGDTQLHAIRNESDLWLDQVFFQQVVAMSQSAYDRSILTGVLRQGRPRPLELQSRDQVLVALYADPHAVSYVWKKDIVGNQRIRVLRVLWDD